MRDAYKIPNPKTITTANLCLFGNFNLTNTGIGKNTIHMSVAICNAAFKNQSDCGRHLCCEAGLQKSDAGMQNINELRTSQSAMIGMMHRLIVTVRRYLLIIGRRRR
jgi:hypothetical protein